MTECRYYEMCSLRASIRNLPPSCDRRSCWMFRPMPDVDALLALVDEMKRKAQEYVERFDENSSTASALNGYASRVREACGEMV